MNMTDVIKLDARNAEMLAESAGWLRQELDTRDVEHPACPHLARAERLLHGAAADLLAAAEAHTEHRASA